MEPEAAHRDIPAGRASLSYPSGRFSGTASSSTPSAPRTVDSGCDIAAHPVAQVAQVAHWSADQP
jgi:hypothetical protein